MSSTNLPREPRNLNFVVVPVVRDLISVGAFAVIFICIHELATPFRRGFHCEDETIRYPYKDSTVPTSVCYLTGTGLNILLILVFEYRAVFSKPADGRDQSENCKIRVFLRNTYCRLIVWLFGALASELITDISKYTAGRLRPHFISVCNPMVTSEDGRVLKLDDYCRETNFKFKYITDYNCINEKRDTRLSFMSGHSSYSAYSAAFAVFYLQSVMDVENLGFIKPAFQVLIASAAFYTGLTRVSDYKHHWQDVLAGLSQGTLMAALATHYIWPSVQRAYTNCMKNAFPRAGDEQGEELNRVSY